MDGICSFCWASLSRHSGQKAASKRAALELWINSNGPILGLHSGSPFWVSILGLHSESPFRISIPGFHPGFPLAGSNQHKPFRTIRILFIQHHHCVPVALSTTPPTFSLLYFFFFFFVVAFFLFPSGRFEHVFLHADYNSFSALIPYPAGPTGWRYCVPIIFKMMFIDFSLSLWERVILDFALETVSDLFKHCYCNNSGGINRVFSFWVRNRRRFQ